MADQINENYMKWLAELRNRKRFTLALNEELKKYSAAIEFVEKIDDPKLRDLQLIRRNIDAIINNSTNWDAKKKQYTSSVQFVENANTAQWIDAYVTKRVESAFTIKIAGIALTDNYTDQYQIKSYKSLLGNPMPTDDWEAVATFKKGTPIKQGIKRFYAVQVGESKYTKTGGFEVSLPVYVEVTKEDLEYSYNLGEYRSVKRLLGTELEERISKYVPKKEEK